MHTLAIGDGANDVSMIQVIFFLIFRGFYDNFYVHCFHFTISDRRRWCRYFRNGRHASSDGV